MKSVLMQHMRTTNIPTSESIMGFGMDGKTIITNNLNSPIFLLYYLFEDKIIDLSSRAFFLGAGGHYYYDEKGLCVFGISPLVNLNSNSRAHFFLDQYGYEAVSVYETTIGGMFIYSSGYGIINANTEFFIYQSNTELRKCLWGDYINYFNAHGFPDANLIPYTVLALDFNGYNDDGFATLLGSGIVDQSLSTSNHTDITGFTAGIEPIISIYSGIGSAASNQQITMDGIGQTAVANYIYSYLNTDSVGQLFVQGSPATVTHYNGTSDNVFNIKFNDINMFNKINFNFIKLFPAFGKFYAIINNGGPFYELYENGPSHINWEYSLTYQPVILQNYKLGVK